MFKKGKFDTYQLINEQFFKIKFVFIKKFFLQFLKNLSLNNIG